MTDEPNWEEDQREGLTNPFQSPGSDAAPLVPDEEQTGRSGPAWERDAPSVASFLATFRELLAQPKLCFAQMRQQGGISPPLLFAVVGMMGTLLLGMVLGLLIEAGKYALGIHSPVHDLADLGLPFLIFAFAIGMLCSLAMWPVMIVIIVAIGSALIHAMLAIIGESRYGFETTLRAVSYCAGSTYIFGIIPFAGQYVLPIVFCIYAILGVSALHEVSGMRASVAVLVPTVTCYTLMVVGSYMLVTSLGQPAGQPFQFR